MNTRVRFHASFFLLLFLSTTLVAKVPAKVDVVIIGAGLSGLGTAYELKKAGIPFHVLELTPRIGGRVRTVRYERGGETVYADSGMEEYWESNPAVELLKELKLPTRIDVAVSSIVLEKKLYPLGDETAEQFQKRVFNAEEMKALAKFKGELAPLVHQLSTSRPTSPQLLKLKERSFADWVGDRKLPPKVSDWVRVSIECEVGTAWDRISAVDGIAEFHIFVGEGEKAARVLGGNDQFTDALGKAVGLKRISLNKRVNAVTTKGKEVIVSYLDLETNRNGTVKTSHVVSTVPLYRLHLEVQFDPPLSEKKREAIASMGWGSYFKAHIFVDPKAERFWIKDGVSMLPILSDSELGVIYDANPDQKVKTRVLSLLITGDHAERYNMMPLEAVRGELKGAFEKLWPGFAKQIKEVEFYRYHPRAIAAWPPGRSRFDELSHEVRKPEHGVYLAGDFTESSHSDGAFLSASRVARQIKEARKQRTVTAQ